jgi:hypothetical protein
VRIFKLIFLLLIASPSSASAQRVSSNPGSDLLQVVKAVTDSGRVDDPAAVSALMHLSFNRTSHRVVGPGPDTFTGAAGSKMVSSKYVETGDNWFPPPPSKQKMVYVDDRDRLFNPINPARFPSHEAQVTGVYALGFGFNELTQRDPSGKNGREVVLNHPRIDYTAGGFSGDHGESDASIKIFDIPAYACITDAQITAVFKSAAAAHVKPAATAPMGRDSYDYQSSNATVGFVILPLPGLGLECLISMDLEARYPLGPLHRLDLAK